jgi:hypothetical protein
MSKSNKSKQEKESLIEKKEEKPANANQPPATNTSKTAEIQVKTPSKFE